MWILKRDGKKMKKMNKFTHMDKKDGEDERTCGLIFLKVVPRFKDFI
jgi:hypothetical protein